MRLEQIRKPSLPTITSKRPVLTTLVSVMNGGSDVRIAHTHLTTYAFVHMGMVLSTRMYVDMQWASHLVVSPGFRPDGETGEQMSDPAVFMLYH